MGAPKRVVRRAEFWQFWSADKGEGPAFRPVHD